MLARYMMWYGYDMIRYNTLKAKKEKYFTSIKIIRTKNLLTPRKQAKQRKEKQSKPNKARQTNELNFSVRNDNPKTRKPLHLPIQGLLSLKKRRLPTLPLLRSTIGVTELNFSVRNGKRWNLSAIVTWIRQTWCKK